MEYRARIARVDLDREASEIVELDDSLLRKYIGGVGLAAKIIWDETSADTLPFSRENRLMFMIGPVTGKVPQSSRAAICGLAPANDAWGESFMGGTWGAEFARTGLSGIIIFGEAKTPVYLYVKNDEIQIKDATRVWGKDTFETNDILHQETDQKASVAATGPAGENRVRYAAVVVDGRFGRVAARCGFGGVMGSKNLKAVVVRGTRRKPEVFDEAELKAVSKEVTTFLTRIKKGELGRFKPETRTAIASKYKMGGMGVKNNSRGRWEAFATKFDETYKQGKHYYCRLCPISCLESHVIETGRQNVLHMITSAGPNCLIDDLDAIQLGYELCNRYGIDNISFGVTLSFAMEAFEKGLINKQDTGGVNLSWGNADVMIEMIKQIGEAKGFGRILGQGALRAAQQIGKGSIQYALHVKGLEVPCNWESRVLNSLALAYATGNRGASHYESPGHAIERRDLTLGYGIDVAELGYPDGMQRLGYENKAGLIKKIQDVVCLINSLVICQYAYQYYGVSLATHLRWLNAITGWGLRMDEFIRTGERIFNLKRLINQRHGFTGKDDTLPARLLEKLPDVSDEEQRVPDSLEEQLQEYYALRGWDIKGVPTDQRLQELSLS
jgi:aldehyde:ferredoxin oxidoreductase